MRKAQKQEILECLKSLRQAHDEIRAALRKKFSDDDQAEQHRQNVMKMFCECQDFGFSIGEIIENIEGEGHITVKYLEEYCELLYQIFEKLNKRTVEENKINKILSGQLLKIENSVRNDIPVSKEVVFFPYKASMWDSLESFWLAARDDSECASYVVPIPYFDKNPDGTFREMHYEGEQYPEYVPIVDWKSYNVEEHRPDVILIHNPYDQCNYVTSVHPDYYAEKLRKYTDMLVYCPYFVGINNQVAEHLCTAPGVLYADRVIVESEDVRKIYLDAIRQFEQANRCSGQFGDLRKKIKVSKFGSPKIERVKRIRYEDKDVPVDWSKLINREDGTRKKVVLYNTTVDAALKYSDYFLEKIKHVISVFKSNKEIVLLWRPHPLLFSTLYAMRPHLYQGLFHIVEQYQRERWGIYDDTADIDRAIALSDAYYGDWSSVVTLYQTTGKPIMIANYETSIKCGD